MTYLRRGMEAEVVNSCYSASKDPQGHVKVAVHVEQILLESYFLKQNDTEKEVQCSVFRPDVHTWKGEDTSRTG